jgi:hypothetical protein
VSYIADVSDAVSDAVSGNMIIEVKMELSIAFYPLDFVAGKRYMRHPELNNA